MTKQELITAIFQNLNALKIEKIKDIFLNQQYNPSYSFDANSDELLIILTKLSLLEAVRDNGKIDTLSFFSLQEINSNLASLVSHTVNFISDSNNATYAQNYFTHFKTLVTSLDRYGFEFLSNSRMPSFAQRERQIQEIEEILTQLKTQYDEDAVDNKIEIMQNLIKKIDSLNEIEIDILLASVSDFEIKKTAIDELYAKHNSLEQELELYQTAKDEEIAKNQNNMNEYLKQLQEIVNEKSELFDNDRKEYQQEKKSLIDDLKSIQEEAKKTLDWATSSSLSSSFQKKVKRARGEFWGYFVGFLSFGLLMMIFGYMMFFAPQLLSNIVAKFFNVEAVIINNSIDPILLFFFKSMTMVPFVIIVSFFWASYKKSKELFEEYDYKTILAQSLMTYFTYLKEKSVLDDKEIKEHTIFVSLKRLLENPVELVYKRTQNDDKNFFEKNKDDLNKIIEEVIKRVKIT
ncbi:MAG: hypothetical protein EOM50_06225 [Erysipelotrichia bacterium]|nr:hypothetical protein [Erysipelotrichia bacterium]